MKTRTLLRRVDGLLRAFVRASLAASLVAALTPCPSPAAEPDAPGQTKLIKTLNPQEFPELAPGKKIWTPSNNDEWAYDGALVGRWLFAASAPGRALIRCEIDRASGAPEFRQAWPIEATDTESGGVWLHVRRPSGKAPLLYVFFSTHHETSLLCYEVNAASGELTLLGKSDQKMFPASDVGGGYGYPAFVWSPDGQRLYYVGVRKILTYTFADDGLPKAEGPALECRNPGSNKFRGRGHALFSPDGRQLYLLTEKPAEADGAWWQIDTYACDPASGALSYTATLDLPALAQECAELLAFSPDATRLLVIDEKPASLCTLGRDAQTGALSILASVKPDASLNGVGGPPWARGGKFAISPDATTALYLGNRNFGTLKLDPQTGTLGDASSIGGQWAKMVYDPAAGNVYLIGGQRISAFRLAK